MKFPSSDMDGHKACLTPARAPEELVWYPPNAELSHMLSTRDFPKEIHK